MTVDATYPKGLSGKVTVETSITPAVAAGYQLQSWAYLNPANNPVIGAYINGAGGGYNLHIEAGGVDGNTTSTVIVCQPTDTIDGVLARISAQLGAGSNLPNDLIVVTGRDTAGLPYIKLRKAGNGTAYLGMWDDYNYPAFGATCGVADLLLMGYPGDAQLGLIDGMERRRYHLEVRGVCQHPQQRLVDVPAQTTAWPTTRERSCTAPGRTARLASTSRKTRLTS